MKYLESRGAGKM